MKLYVQLALVCSTLLVIPWTGCEFLRANEAALLKLQRQSVEAAGISIADGLYGNTELIYRDPQRARSADTPTSIRALRLPGTPVLDGYFDEWRFVAPQRFGTERRRVAIRAGAHGEMLYLAVSVRDNSKRYDTSATGAQPVGDRLHLRTWISGRRQDYVIATPAPGAVRATVVGRRLPAAEPSRITGIWTDIAEGYQIELALPLSVATARLGIYMTNEDEGGVSTQGNIDPLSTEAPPWLVVTTQRLARLVSNYDGNAMGVQILDRWGRLLAESSTEKPDNMTATDTTSWLSAWLYESVLAAPIPDVEPSDGPHGHVYSDDIDSALRGLPRHGLASTEQGLVSRYVTPIRSAEGVIGAVVTTQGRETYLSATASAFEGLLLQGTLALLLALLAFFVFTLWLSWRVVRLTHATELMTRHPQLDLPQSPLKDEIDSLAGRVTALFREQARLMSYLKTLPGSLTHEIRTPVAITRSALEHLREPDLSPAHRDELINRADGGLKRLSNMINAMNEANRLESALHDEPKVTVDLIALLTDLAKAYRQTFPDWQFEVVTDIDTAICELSPDLIVQAMEKLVVNATSFSTPGDTVLLQLEARGLWWRLSVSNPGPLLPTDTENLFAPMVTRRERAHSNPGNIGLGLYIVSLIARHHGGEPWAQNRDDGDGAQVGFTVLQ